MRLILFFLLIFAPIFQTLFADSNKISVITIDDQIISPVTAEYIEEAIAQAERRGDQALVIEMDTPGGLLASTRKIVKRLLNAEVPVIVYVAPSGARAGSAGVFITLAANLAAMAPSTNIGAAHPVEFGEGPKKKEGESFREIFREFRKREKKDRKLLKTKEPLPTDPMSEKILNDTVAWVSTIAKSRGRNVDWAVRAVKESISDGETEALRQGVVDLVAKDLDDLLKKIDGRLVTLPSGKKVTLQTAPIGIERVPMGFRQKILDILINPNIAYLLMMLGFYGLLFEITHPGVWFPGVAGLICIILAFYAFHTLPTNYAGVALIFLSIALFVAESFVPSYGLLTIVAVICMLLGSLFLVDSRAEFMQISLKVIIPVVVATGLLFSFLVGLALKMRRQKSPLGLEGLIGTVGEVGSGGRLQIGGELWEIEAEEPLFPGQVVKVISVSGLKLKVKKN